MNRRQVVLLIRNQLESDTTPETAKLWFSRLCALYYMNVNQIPWDFTHLALFADFDGVLTESLQKILTSFSQIPLQDWEHQPELLGWLYQDYNTPERESAFSNLQKKIKIPTEKIPCATQLFTPDWIVKSMVQNALGTVCQPLADRGYFLGCPQSMGKSVRDVTILDPCTGTGHILAYCFDALLSLYLHEGFSVEDAVLSILSHNLYGMDIDKGAILLAEFILYMKAVPFVPDILSRGLQLNLQHFADFGDVPECFANAETFGSLLRVPVMGENRIRVLSEMLNRKYSVVVTNPPYMGANGMNPLLQEFIKREYPAGRWDLFSAFMIRCAEFTAQDGVFSMITQHGWMFLSSYAKLRKFMQNYTLQSLVHFGAKAFSLADVGTIVQTASFTAFGRKIPDYSSVFLRLIECDDKETAYFNPHYRYECTAERLANLPDVPLCYWISDKMLDLMQEPKLGDYCPIRQGMTTSDNRRFLRKWYELPKNQIAFGCHNADEAQQSRKTWFPYNKGGRIRRWYGNHSWVVNYRNNGEELRSFHAELNKTSSGGRLKNPECYFQAGVTWSFITESTRFGVRYQPEGFLFDVSGSSLFPKKEDAFYIMGLLASGVALEILKLFNPTMNYQVENIKNIPLRIDRNRQLEIDTLVKENILISRQDWDSSEQSWDFVTHPMLAQNQTSLELAFAGWSRVCQNRIRTLQQNEIRLNQIFSEIYDFPYHAIVPDTSLQNPSPKDACESLLNFALGCILGRYQMDGITVRDFLPLCEFADEIKCFLAVAYGDESLSDNIQWLECALQMSLGDYGMKKLYSVHCRMYRKRPVYWLVSSGRKRAVYGMFYIHRFPEGFTAMLSEVTENYSDSPELQKWRKSLQEIKRVPYSPDDGVLCNHQKFQSILARIY